MLFLPKISHLCQMNKSDIKETLRHNWSYIAVVVMAFFLFRCCSNNESIDTIPETPSSGEYVDSVLNENRILTERNVFISEQLRDLTIKHTIDSLEHVKDILAYKKLSRKHKVVVIERNIGPVIDTLGMTCLDSVQMDSVNITYKRLSNCEGVVEYQREKISLQSKSIDIYKEKEGNYVLVIDTLEGENFQLRDENGQLRVASKKFIKKIRNNRRIAIVSSVTAVLEGAVLYLLFKK